MTKQQEQLVENNMNLVYFAISKYYPKHIQDEDIIQVGMVGLCKAVKKWDEEKWNEEKCAFSTFAVHIIRREISFEFRKQSKRPKTISLDYELSNKTGTSLTLEDILVGDSDVEYVDLPALYKRLTPFQQEILDLKREGLTQTEIAERFGCSKENIGQQMRKIKYKWKMVISN